ncbi:MAG: CoA transferase [Anaerolineae bacterium]|nr:CoA transferase [Anaerolineae bacterium]MBK9094673.1 CoA transferase [Anaerolineae bacterium]MBK9231861.1 CoA transferase [Anaerolineae bacterium]
MTEALAGPLCAMMLGDLGADVLKIERPGSGDMSRGWAPPYVGTESAYFLSTNRNKRSMTLNLKHPAAQAVLHQLVRTADVFVVNQPSLESLRKLAADPDTLWAINPRLVYCAVSGFGLTGPEAGQGGYDVVAQARSGLMALTGEPGSGPMRYPIPLSDATCGVYSVIGILSALRVREQTGRGQLVDMALLDGQVSWLTHVAGAYFATGQRPSKIGNTHATIVPYQSFRARDKHMVVAVGSERLWQRFCQTLAIEQTVGQDPRFRTNSDRLQHRADLIPLLAEVFATQDASFWLERLRAADIPCGPINEVDEALNDPQVVARGMIVEQEHPVVGPVRSVGNPVHLSETPVSYRLPPPSLGQHTVEVLRSLGYADEQIEQLRAEGAA